MVSIKNREEIEIMREGGRLLSQLSKELAEQIKPGITGLDLNAWVEQFAAQHQATPSFLNYRGYPKALCVSINDQVVHALPTNEPFREGDVVALDVGLKYRGLHLDMAFTQGVGGIGEQAQRLIQATRRALKKGVRAARAGALLSEIGRAMEEEVKREGFTIVRQFTGHGIGRDLHEEPSVPSYEDSPPALARLVLPKGATLALEPVVTAGGEEVLTAPDGWTVRTKDGSLSAHFEVTILVGDEEGEILTPLP